MQNLPTAEQLVGQTPGNVVPGPEQAQTGQMMGNVAMPTMAAPEQVSAPVALPTPPENGVSGVDNAVMMNGAAQGAPAVGAEDVAAAGAITNPPVLPEVQVPVDLPELPKPTPPDGTPPNQSSAFQIPGM